MLLDECEPSQSVEALQVRASFENERWMHLLNRGLDRNQHEVKFWNGYLTRLVGLRGIQPDFRVGLRDYPYLANWPPARVMNADINLFALSLIKIEVPIVNKARLQSVAGVFDIHFQQNIWCIHLVLPLIRSIVETAAAYGQ